MPVNSLRQHRFKVLNTMGSIYKFPTTYQCAKHPRTSSTVSQLCADNAEAWPWPSRIKLQSHISLQMDCKPYLCANHCGLNIACAHCPRTLAVRDGSSSSPFRPPYPQKSSNHISTNCFLFWDIRISERINYWAYSNSPSWSLFRGHGPQFISLSFCSPSFSTLPLGKTSGVYSF